MDALQLAGMLRRRASALELDAGPIRGPNAPARPDGPSEAELTGKVLRLMAAEYRELAAELTREG